MVLIYAVSLPVDILAARRPKQGYNEAAPAVIPSCCQKGGRMYSSRLVLAALLVVTVLAGSALVVIPAPAQEKENPIAAQVKAAVKDPAKPFTLIVRLRIKEGVAAKFEAAFAKARKATRQEKGNAAYDLNRDAKTPTQYLVYERWQSVAALETHLKSPHITTLLAELGDLLAAPPEASIFLPTGE
jgi:quinol monooxygenase YgiN